MSGIRADLFNKIEISPVIRGQKLFKKAKTITFPLRVTLVTTVIVSLFVAITLTVGFMGVPAYTKAKKSFRVLWKELSRQTSETVTEKILKFFQSAPITLKFIEGLVEKEVITLKSKEKIFDICYRALKENPPFSSVYYALKNGTFVGVEKDAGKYWGSYRTLLDDNQTLVELYEISQNSNWIQFHQELTDYDPRSRPFWKTGEQNPKGSWTDPYRFARSQKMGYSYVVGQKGVKGIEGYWAVDFEIDQLSDFLKQLHIGTEGMVSILTEKGELIARSKPKISSRDQVRQEKAFSLFMKSPELEGYEEGKRRIFFIDRFPPKSKIPWTLVTMIHESDYLGPIRKSAIQSFYWGLIPCLFFVILSGIFFGKISRRLKRIAYQIDRVGNLVFEPIMMEHSRIREVNMMERALTRMRAGMKSFSRYVSIDLVKKLIQSGKSAKLGGDKRSISVLFADLSKFTSLAEKSEIDEVVQVLGEFLDAATQEVHKAKGTVDKFVGDSIMALWGAPDPIDNHALRACQMALNLLEISKKNEKMHFKCGINTGEAFVGNFGSHTRMDYTAIGDSVNLAARLEKLNKIYETQILIGPETARQVREHLNIRLLDAMYIPGRSGLTDIYELYYEESREGFRIFEEALKLFRNKEFSQAIIKFKEANQLLKGDDLPSKVYIESSKRYIKTPPPDDWGGEREPIKF